MEFISNLMKRPLSLVLTEPSTVEAADKFPVQSPSSSSAPNSINELNCQNLIQFSPENNHKNIEGGDADTATVLSEKFMQPNFAPLETSSPKSFSSATVKDSTIVDADNTISDFIGVPDHILPKFEDIFPAFTTQQRHTQHPLQLSASSSAAFPLVQNMDRNTSLSRSSSTSKTSQTIEQLLVEINDNLNQAGLNDEVFAIASPVREQSPLSGKNSLSNSKLNSSQTASPNKVTAPQTTLTSMAAGTATIPTVFEANSSLHKFPIDTELEKAQLFEESNNDDSGINKSTNKFAGLTEFDETKIPELPCDLNPNLEEQYKATFEECFIPTTSTSNQQAEPIMQLLVATQALDVTADSSDIDESFADCHDNKDPLATTFNEPNLNTTTEFDSYISAVNTTDNINDLTNDDIAVAVASADLTMEADALQASYASAIVEPLAVQYEDEPMDVDMNNTMEIIQNSSANLENMQRVLQHAEDILQDIEENKQTQQSEPAVQKTNKEIQLEQLTDKPNESSDKTMPADPIGLDNDNTPTVDTETSNIQICLESKKMPKVSEFLEMEKSHYDKSLNKSLEIPVKETKTLSSECIIQTLAHETASNSNSITETTLSTSSSSNSSASNDKTAEPALVKKSLAATSAAFPTKQTANQGFPRSPKAEANNQHNKETFLEKSDYLDKKTETFLQPEVPADSQKKKRLTFNCPATDDKPNEQPENLQEKPKENQRRTFNVMPNENENAPASTQDKPNVQPLDAENLQENQRRTFNVMPNETEDAPASTQDKPNVQPLDAENLQENQRLTFNVMSNENQDALSSTIDSKPNAQPLDAENLQENQRLTFNVMSNEKENAASIHADKSDTTRRTFSATSVDLKDTNDLQKSQEEKVQPTRTLNVTLEKVNWSASAADASFEPMDVDEIEQHTVSENENKLPEEQQKSAALPTILQPRSQSPILPSMQPKSHSPPLATMQPRAETPPLANMQSSICTSKLLATQPETPEFNCISSPETPVLPKLSKPNNIKEDQRITSPEEEQRLASQEEEEEDNSLSSEATASPAMVAMPNKQILKRPPIRPPPQTLSAKEQSTIRVRDEKDILEKFSPSPIEETFTPVSATSTTLTNTSGFSEFDQNSQNSLMLQQQMSDEEFGGNNNLVLNPCDFDYLLTKGNNNVPVDRSSLLLKFDPLLGLPVPVAPSAAAQQQQLLQLPRNTNPCLSPTLEEDEHNISNRSFVIENSQNNATFARGSGAENLLGYAACGAEADFESAKLLKERSQEVNKQFKQPLPRQFSGQQQIVNKKHATMSVDVIKDMNLDNNDCNKTFDNSNSSPTDDKQNNYKMDELEKKIKNEVLKTEDIEKKLKDAEQKEEALIKRITEKDKTISKMNGVIEAYEKAIAELISEKEQLIQNYEKQLAEVKADRDSNYHHLTSLETTFSDLHVKYEKSKEMTSQLKANEDLLLTDKRQQLENLRLQEQRYEKMKNHAMQQLEIANRKLESLSREHTIETSKLKALLKKEEVAHLAAAEQLLNKTKENSELVKICDELIANQGGS